MSVDYWLFRGSINDDPNQAELLAFGSQDETIERLCSIVGFELFRRENSSDTGHRAIVTYIYHNKDDEGRSVEFALLGDPVDCISINRAYLEDFLPVINAFNELSPFVIFGLEGEPIDPEELFYSYDDWVEKNYEEGYLLFSYEGYS